MPNKKDKQYYNSDFIMRDLINDADELRLNAKKIRKYKDRAEVVRFLEESINQKMDISILEEVLWEVILQFENCFLYTLKGLRFTYSIKGYEMFVSRKEKSITKSTILIAFRNALELQGNVNGPKQLKTFGASYLYALFKRIRIIY